MEFEIYHCSHCGNIITFLTNKGVPVFCCGTKMERLTPNTTDAATEKHVPVIERNGCRVRVIIGETEHPMIPEHYIEWIILRTDQKVMIAHLHPGQSPEAQFTLEENEKIVEAYEYCNIHGLWKKNG